MISGCIENKTGKTKIDSYNLNRKNKIKNR